MSNSRRSGRGGAGGLRDLRRALARACAVFGSLAVLTVMALGHGSDRMPRYADMGLDEMTTGSVAADSRYVVSRSVLQPAGALPCIMFPDGTRRGGC